MSATQVRIAIEDINHRFGGVFLLCGASLLHPAPRAMHRWSKRRFRPDQFDLPNTNKAIVKALRRCRGGYRFKVEG
jgi:hypothetical protein